MALNRLRLVFASFDHTFNPLSLHVENDVEVFSVDKSNEVFGHKLEIPSSFLDCFVPGLTLLIFEINLVFCNKNILLTFSRTNHKLPVLVVDV